jgi:hypothetical protein
MGIFISEEHFTSFFKLEVKVVVISSARIMITFCKTAWYLVDNNPDFECCRNC